MNIDLKKIREKLDMGAMTDIAKEFGCTRAHIYLVLAGKRRNLKILEAAILKAQATTSKEKELEDAAQQI